VRIDSGLGLREAEPQRGLGLKAAAARLKTSARYERTRQPSLSHPPVKPARRKPATMGGQLRMRRQINPER
jgi:hypothetical protein